MFRFRVLILLILVCLLALPSSWLIAQEEVEWELAETAELSWAIRNFDSDILYPTGWLVASEPPTLIINELEADHEIALDGSFATQGYSISFVFQNQRDLGLSICNTTLEDMLEANKQLYGYQEPLVVSETDCLSWPALRVETIDGMGNYLSVVQGFYGASGAFTFTLAAPSQESLDAFLPTWKSMLENIRIDTGTVRFGNGYLELKCSGEGSPAVILEANVLPANGTVDWSQTRRELENVTRVCSHSWPVQMVAQNSETLATLYDYTDNLHNLLRAASVDGPYVLVGPYVGAFFVRVYAERYPDDVVGMVFVDGFHPDVWERELENLSMDTEEERGEYYQSVIDLWKGAGLDFETSVEQVAATGPFGNLPLIVLTPEIWGLGVPPPPYTEEKVEAWHRIWTDELQAALAALSTNSTLVIVEGAGHGGMPAEPAVAEAILQVIEDIHAQED